MKKRETCEATFPFRDGTIRCEGPAGHQGVHWVTMHPIGPVRQLLRRLGLAR